MSGKLYLVLYEFSNLLMKVTFINVLWGLVNLPVFIVLMQIALTTDVSHMTLLLPILSILTPILFFPGTQALISSIRAFILEDDFHPFTFFAFYRQGYKASLVTGIGYTSLASILGYLFTLTYARYTLLSIALLVAFFYLNLLTCHLLYMDTHYAMPMDWKIRQTLLFVLKYPVFAFTNFLLFSVLHYILYSVSFILFTLFGTGLVVYATYYLFLRKLAKIKGQTVISK